MLSPRRVCMHGNACLTHMRQGELHRDLCPAWNSGKPPGSPPRWTGFGPSHGRQAFRPIPSEPMASRSSIRRRPPLDRDVRSWWARCVLAVVLIPILVLGAFGGTTFLAHAHDGHDLHLHAAPSIEGARHAAEQHRLAHASGIARCDHLHAAAHGHSRSAEVPSEPIENPALPTPTEDPSGLVITIPDHEQLASRGIDLSQSFKSAQVFQRLLASFWSQPDVSEETGSPGGCDPSGPRHLCALTAGQRLVRTSQALLI